MNDRDTKIHPPHPLPTKAHSLKNSNEKVPRYMITGPFDVKLPDNSGKIGFDK